MLPATPNRLVMAWFDGWCRRALRRHFHRVHLYAQDEAQWRGFDPAVSRLYVANHCSFWDGIVLYHLIRRHRRQPVYCMVDAVQVAEHPFFRRVGCFSVDRTRPRDGLAAVRHAADLLNRSPCAVVVFPQGAIRPADARPLAFEPGVARIIDAAPSAVVVPVALRYEFWVEQRAEALIHLGRERKWDSDQTTRSLEFEVAALLDTTAALGRQHRASPHVLLHGRRSISRWKSLSP